MNGNAAIKTTVAGSAAGDPLTVWLQNVANPSAAVAGVHMTVSTSSDPTPVASGTYSIVAAHGVSTSTVRLTTAAAAATGVDYLLSFTTWSTGVLRGCGADVCAAALAGTSFVNTRIVVTDAL